MNIIEFIMSNLVFIIIIVWFLFSLFGRRGAGSEEEEGQRRRAPRPQHRQPEPVSGPNQQPQRQSEPQVRVQRTEDSDTELGFPWERVEDAGGTDSGERNDSPLGRDMSQTAHTINRYEQYVQELQEQGQRGRTRAGNKNKHRTMTAEQAAFERRRPSSRRRASEGRLIPDFQQMNESSVVKGFVWSEVFGAPLAKRKQRVYSMDQRMGRRHYP